MDKQIENPLAFPRAYSQHNDDVKNLESFDQQDGMTLRDYFAGQALNGFLSSPKLTNGQPGVLAMDAYAIADAMLSERMKAKGGDR